MKHLAKILACLVVLGTWIDAKDCYAVTIDDILPIGYRLAKEGTEGGFTMFAFEESSDFESDHQLNIQFSIENRKFGLDWVFKAPRNITDSNRFKSFAEAKGYTVMKRSMNGVDYYRVEEGGSLFSLCKAVITELYEIPSEAEICLVYSGVEF